MSALRFVFFGTCVSFSVWCFVSSHLFSSFPHGNYIQKSLVGKSRTAWKVSRSYETKDSPPLSIVLRPPRVSLGGSGGNPRLHEACWVACAMCHAPFKVQGNSILPHKGSRKRPQILYSDFLNTPEKIHHRQEKNHIENGDVPIRHELVSITIILKRLRSLRWQKVHRWTEQTYAPAPSGASSTLSHARLLLWHRYCRLQWRWPARWEKRQQSTWMAPHPSNTGK